MKILLVPTVYCLTPSRHSLYIQFYHHSHLRMNWSILFCGRYLPLLNEVLHLGHILTYNLSDDRDILSKCKDMIRKANSFVLILKPPSHCPHLPLSLRLLIIIWVWSLKNISSKCLKTLEVSFNKILRGIWNLPYNSHMRIVHGTAKLPSLFNLTFSRTTTLFTISKNVSSYLVK